MFTFIKSIIMQRRIIKFRRKYIPQILTTKGWMGIDNNGINVFKGEDQMLNYCSHDSISDATIAMYDWIKRVEKEKERKREAKEKVVYVPEPEAWVRLKQRKEK